MDTFHERLGPALEHEKKVIQWLIFKGCLAVPFGQGVLPVAIRDALKNCQDSDKNPALIRWLPDILAVYEPLMLPLLIEAKQGVRHSDTGNHSIEQNSLKTMLQIEKALNISVWFVFPEGAGISAQGADHVKWEGPNIGRTSYWLISGEDTIQEGELFQQMLAPIPKGRYCQVCRSYVESEYAIEGRKVYAFCPKCNLIISAKMTP
jgi:hypothetical protein